jgi:hypothetical protein
MKKVILSATSFALFSLILSSCEKEEVKTNDSVLVAETISTEKGSGFEEKAKGNSRVWFDNGSPTGVDGVDYGCKDTGGNCRADVSVSPGIMNDIRNIGDVVKTKNKNLIKHEFITKRAILEVAIDDQYIDNVIKGGLDVDVRGEEGTMYFLFLAPGNGNVVKAFPIK